MIVAQNPLLGALAQEPLGQIPTTFDDDTTFSDDTSFDQPES